MIELEIPSWFGKPEFYAILYTVWFGLICYLVIGLIKAKKDINVKDNISKLKEWRKNRKQKKEEKLLGEPLKYK